MSWLKYAALNNFQYQLPSNPQQLIYDFYMASLLYKPQSAYKNDKLAHIVQETKAKLVSDLKAKLLDDLFYIICCEIRHVFNQNGSTLFGSGGNYGDFLKNDGRESTLPLLREYEKLWNENSPNAPELNKKHDHKGKNAEYTASWLAAKAAMEKLQASPEDFVKMAESLFTNAYWQDSYGGQAWASIAHAWLELNSKKSLGDAQAYIDHVIDLQHNTGSMFNKMNSWAIAGEWKWIKEALDKKSKVISPYDLMLMCSPSMKFIAARALHDTDGADLQSNMGSIAKYWEGYISADYMNLLQVPDEAIAYMQPEFYTRGVIRLLEEYPQYYSYLPDILKKCVSVEQLKSYFIRKIKRRLDSFTDFMPELQKLFSEQELSEVLYMALEDNPQYVSYLSPQSFKYLLLQPDKFTNLLQTLQKMKKFEKMVHFLDEIPEQYRPLVAKGYEEMMLRNNPMAGTLPKVYWQYINPQIFKDFIKRLFYDTPEMLDRLDSHHANYAELYKMIPPQEWKKVWFNKFALYPWAIENLPTVSREFTDQDRFELWKNWVIHTADRANISDFLAGVHAQIPLSIRQSLEDYFANATVNKPANKVDKWVKFLWDNKAAKMNPENFIPHDVLSQVMEKFNAMLMANTPAYPILDKIAQWVADTTRNNANEGYESLVRTLFYEMELMYRAPVMNLLENDPKYDMPLDFWLIPLSQGKKIKIPPAYADKLHAAMDEAKRAESWRDINWWIGYISQAENPVAFFEQQKINIPPDLIQFIHADLIRAGIRLPPLEQQAQPQAAAPQLQRA